MQQHQFEITANKRPETLERLLRVVRHRGFEVLALHVESQAQTLTLAFTVQSERDITLLYHQLEKLPDVITLQ